MMNNEITLSINSTVCKGVVGDSILAVALKGGEKIPTLCHMEGLCDIGACRMCVVDVEGNPKMLTACTSPAVDGMKVHTHTEKLLKYRKQVLELLFAGRNHFCMYCSQSGDCELQTLAIEHGMDSVRYPFLFGKFENDTTGDKLMMDANRCVLCQRCTRTCDDKAGTHTLDLKDRGWVACVTKGFGEKWGESETCVKCGACAQNCPTGTITIREHAYRGRKSECDAPIKSTCPLCAMGCEINAYVRSGTLARVEGANLSGPDAGQLCEKGRWGLVRSNEAERITSPMLRVANIMNGSEFVSITWEDAFEIISKKYAAAKLAAGALVSPLSTDAEMACFTEYFKDNVQCGGDVEYLAFDRSKFKGTPEDVLQSDYIVNLCTDTQQDAPVLASYVRVAVLRHGAKFAHVTCECCDCSESKLSTIADFNVKANCKEIAKAVAELEGIKSASKPVIIAGKNILSNKDICNKIAELGINVIPVLPYANSAGAPLTQLKTPLDFLYVYSTGLLADTEEELGFVANSRFTVVHTPFLIYPLVNMADVLLPAPAWYEKAGEYSALDGKKRKSCVIIEPKADVKDVCAVMKACG